MEAPMQIMNAAVVTLTVLAPAVAAADADGYFCIGRDYLAYETRAWSGPPSHQLHIVYFGSGRGIVAAAPLHLEEFAVQAMNCGPQSVELRSRTTNYGVDISSASRLAVASHPQAFDAKQIPPGNLGHLAREQVVDLGRDGASYFQLVISRATRAVVDRGTEYYTVSMLVQRGPGGASHDGVLAYRSLYQDVNFEPAD
jgi:hypothetical protein